MHNHIRIKSIGNSVHRHGALYHPTIVTSLGVSIRRGFWPLVVVVVVV